MNAHLAQATATAETQSPKPFAVEAMLPAVEAYMNELALGRYADLTGAMAFRQLSTGGKRVRARLALHACSSFGVSQENAIRWASAIEILHNATLVHDDIQDGDTTRRGKATVWARYGSEQAINAGDFMLMLPFLALSDLPAEKRGLLSTLVADYATRIVRGQVEELSLKANARVEMDDYLSACAGKTGALLALPIVGAAVLAERDLADAERFATPFVQLGLLFQLQDDLIDLFGDKGRETEGCDIYEGKVSALLVSHLRIAPESKDEVLTILDKPRCETTADDVRRVRELYLSSKAPQAVLAQITQISNQVLGSTLLRREPELHHVAKKLVNMALAPIQPLIERGFS